MAGQVDGRFVAEGGTLPTVEGAHNGGPEHTEGYDRDDNKGACPHPGLLHGIRNNHPHPRNSLS